MLLLTAFGGLEAAYIWPVVLGLYWQVGNTVWGIVINGCGRSFVYFDS